MTEQECRIMGAASRLAADFPYVMETHNTTFRIVTRIRYRTEAEVRRAWVEWYEHQLDANPSQTGRVIATLYQEIPHTSERKILFTDASFA